jgi:hypothetical protein
MYQYFYLPKCNHSYKNWKSLIPSCHELEIQHFDQCKACFSATAEQKKKLGDKGEGDGEDDDASGMGKRPHNSYGKIMMNVMPSQMGAGMGAGMGGMGMGGMGMGMGGMGRVGMGGMGGMGWEEWEWEWEGCDGWEGWAAYSRLE